MFKYAAAAFLAGAVHSHGAVMIFSESFESPVLPGGTYLEIVTGVQTFDSAEWDVVNVDWNGAGIGVYLDSGVYFTPFTGGGAQVLAFGGGNSPQNPGDNLIEKVIPGFTGMTAATISYDYFRTATAGQGVNVLVTDPNDGDAVLYDADHYGTGQVVDADFDNLPIGDTVTLTISQIGVTTNSDSAIDNVVINAVPEPMVGLLVALGLAGFGIRRRR